MARKEISTAWDRNNRNNMNDNFTELYNVQNRAIKEATKAVIEDSKLIWQQPVNTFADLATTYPDAITGYTVMTRDTGIVYRYNEGSWKEIQEIDPTAINEVDTRLTAQLAQNMNGIRGSLIERLQAGNVTNIKLIGDSITYGVGATNAGDGVNPDGNLIFQDTDGTKYGEAPENITSWANMFRQYINTNFPSVTFFNAGIGGKSAKWANSRKALWVDDVEDVVFVMLGTNDRWDCATPDEFELNLREFLSYVDSRTNTMIVMTATPTTNDDLPNNPPFNFGIKEVDRVITKVCADEGYAHISHYRLMLDYFRNTKGVATDFLQNPGSHPIDPGYKVMWETIQQELGLIDNQDSWFDFRKPLESIKVLTDWASVLPSTAIDAKDLEDNYLFNEKAITAVSIPNGHGSTHGFPENTGGLLLTYRLALAGDFYAYQEYKTYQSNNKYIRYWRNTRAWSDWDKIMLGTAIERPAALAVGTVQSGKYVRKNITTSQILASTNAVVLSPVSHIPDGIIWSWARAGNQLIYVNFYNAGIADVSVGDLLFNVTQIKP